MKKGTIDTRRNCPSCFRLKEIPTPLPVCRTCIQLIPNKLQSELATAILAGDQKAVLRVTGQVVTGGIDPVLMRDEGREYRETFFSVARRLVRRWPEFKWGLLHPTGKRVIDVERL